MGAIIILILQLGLIITASVFTGSAGHLTTSESKLNLKCLNDFLTEMTCQLTSDRLQLLTVGCFEYSLTMSRGTEKLTCKFTQLNSSMCECTLQVESGFVMNEIYEAHVLRRENVLFTENISTTESIKPKKPINVSVSQTQSGDFQVVWDTVYSTEPVFNKELIPEFTYYIQGSKSEETVTLPKGSQEFQLIGRNLQPNSNYTVKLRLSTDVNLRYSDYSDPYIFTTSPSPMDLLKILIPVICGLLIISILTIYYIYTKILKEWWDKIPTPKIATSFVKQVPNLLSSQNEFLPVHLHSSKLVRAGEKTWPVYSVVDIGSEKGSLSSVGKDGSSSEVIYGQTGNESVDDNSTEFLKDRQTTSLCQISMSDKYYKNLGPNSNSGEIKEGCENSSGISNKFYMLSGSDKLQNPAMEPFINDFNENDNVFPDLTKNRDPVIQTDFEYKPCTGCSGSESSSPTHFTPSSNDIIMAPEYQSFGDVTDRSSMDQEFISAHNDANLLMGKLMCTKNLRNISCESAIIPVENGDFSSLLRNSGEQPSLVGDSEFKCLSGPVLRTSPGIQIDFSYQRV